MKKALLVIALLLAAYALYARNRLFVRDPLGSVTRNGVTEPGAQVYINFANEVLIENDRSPMYVLLLQHGNHIGLPQALHCLHYVVCLTDNDTATLTGGGWNITIDDMTSRQVTFHDKTTATVITIY